MNCSDYIELVCNVVTTITAVLGVCFALIEIRKGTRAQQDGKAPLLIIERNGKSMDGIIRNDGDLTATDVKVSLKIFNRDKTKIKRSLLKPISIIKNESKNIFKLSQEIEDINTDVISKVIIKVKYSSPLNDRKRQCDAVFSRD